MGERGDDIETVDISALGDKVTLPVLEDEIITSGLGVGVTPVPEVETVLHVSGSEILPSTSHAGIMPPALEVGVSTNVPGDSSRSIQDAMMTFEHSLCLDGSDVMCRLFMSYFLARVSVFSYQGCIDLRCNLVRTFYRCRHCGADPLGIETIVLGLLIDTELL